MQHWLCLVAMQSFDQYKQQITYFRVHMQHIEECREATQWLAHQKDWGVFQAWGWLISNSREGATFAGRALAVSLIVLSSER